VEPVHAPGRMLGVSRDAELTSADVELRPGALLLLYTDGILDARADRETFGEQRLRDALVRGAGEAPSTVLRSIEGEVRAFSPGPARDDKALLALRVPPPA
ncbi:MAG TPA: PP2C family protein-serine/threonine phosphatase, partial [Solirubrobacteraceae bacterium]|nr:PP2C family protein-serine/threonine phosphatase [Solirubrobacteraceae bacterium]